MVGKIKKWLGITALENENLTLAKALKKHTERLDVLESVPAPEKELTSAPPKPNMKPKRVNWRQARAALEKASDLKDDE